MPLFLDDLVHLWQFFLCGSNRTTLLETMPPIDVPLAVVDNTMLSAIQLARPLDVVVDTNHVSINLDEVEIDQPLDSQFLYSIKLLWCSSTEIGMKHELTCYLFLWFIHIIILVHMFIEWMIHVAVTFIFYLYLKRVKMLRNFNVSVKDLMLNIWIFVCAWICC